VFDPLIDGLVMLFIWVVFEWLMEYEMYRGALFE